MNKDFLDTLYVDNSGKEERRYAVVTEIAGDEVSLATKKLVAVASKKELLAGMKLEPGVRIFFDSEGKVIDLTPTVTPKERSRTRGAGAAVRAQGKTAALSC